MDLQEKIQTLEELVNRLQRENARLVESRHRRKNVRIVEYPERKGLHGKCLFVVGEEWRASVQERLVTFPVTVVSSRRPMTKPKETPHSEPFEYKTMLEWENAYIDRCQAVMFWFPWESSCAESMFQLGRLARDRRIVLFVGAHPNYRCRESLVQLMKYVRPEVLVASTFEKLMSQLVGWADEQSDGSSQSSLHST